MATYRELKSLISAVSRRGSVLPTTSLENIVHKALCDVALEAHPLLLLTDNIAYEPLLLLEGAAFIRKPNKPLLDDDLMDIDDDLIAAVAYRVLEITEMDNDSKAQFKTMKISEINIHNWRLYESHINRTD